MPHVLPETEVEPKKQESEAPKQKIKVYRDRQHGKYVWFISCPECKYSFERPLKRTAVSFANAHKTTHVPELEVIVVVSKRKVH